MFPFLWIPNILGNVEWKWVRWPRANVMNNPRYWLDWLMFAMIDLHFVKFVD